MISETGDGTNSAHLPSGRWEIHRKLGIFQAGDRRIRKMKGDGRSVITSDKWEKWPKSIGRREKRPITMHLRGIYEAIRQTCSDVVMHWYSFHFLAMESII